MNAGKKIMFMLSVCLAISSIAVAQNNPKADSLKTPEERALDTLIQKNSLDKNKQNTSPNALPNVIPTYPKKPETTPEEKKTPADTANLLSLKNKS